MDDIEWRAQFGGNDAVELSVGGNVVNDSEFIRCADGARVICVILVLYKEGMEISVEERIIELIYVHLLGL